MQDFPPVQILFFYKVSVAFADRSVWCNSRQGFGRFKIKTMKRLVYLNAVLSVIACCLVMITLAITGLLPTASAKDNGRSAPIAVDITRIGGSELSRNELPVNLSRIAGEDVSYKPLPVNIKEADSRPIRSNPVPVAVTK
jgi:hypothetical protein